MKTNLGRSLVFLMFSTALLTSATHVSRSLAASDGSWTQLAPSGTLPAPRCQPVTIYDAVHDRLVAFGGQTWGYDYMDVWALSLGASPQWTQLAPSGPSPSPRVDEAAIYDPVRNRIIIFAGFCRWCEINWPDDVWALSLGDTPEWTQLFPAGTPPSTRTSAWALYDPVRDRMLIFGGEEGAGSNPFGTAALNDVWALSLGAAPEWTQLAPSGSSPSPSVDEAAIYDPVRDRAVMFGGQDMAATLYNDVWELSLASGPQWTQLTPSGVPPVARISHTAVYDPLRDRMVIFGGNSGVYRNDTWELSLGENPQWTQLAPSGTAPTRRLHGAIHDPLRDRMLVVWGDAGFADYQNDVWELNWSGMQLAPLQCPVDVEVPGYSTIRSLSLVGFRITNVGTTPSDFMYSVSATGPATLVDKGDPTSLAGITPVLDPGASYYPPEAGLLVPEIRDYAEERVTYHVADATNSSCTTLIVMEPPVPVLISSFDGSAIEGGVRLTWDIFSDEGISGFRIYRGLEKGSISKAITPAGLLPSNARGYTDENVNGGRSYQYTLGVVLADGSEVRSQIVTVKTKPVVLALEQNIPNPFNPTTVIAFTLPGRSRVTISIYDVEGRLVRTLVDDNVGEGRHEYTWDGKNASGSSVSSGAYFYSLTAGERRITKKMVLLK